MNKEECIKKFEEIFDDIKKGIKERIQYEGISEKNKENRIKDRLYRKNIKDNRKNFKNFDL